MNGHHLLSSRTLPQVPERLDRVFVMLATRREPFALHWDAREQLLAQARRSKRLAHVVAAFEAVGASRPVQLTGPDKRLLVQLIDAWSAREETISSLPAGIWDLRMALADDLGLGPEHQF
jgi:hypothetical protein